MTERRPPCFTGVSTYLDPLGRFSFRYPTDWHRFALEGREGVMFAPNPEDLQTAFTAWVTALEHGVVAEDLENLRHGVREGLAQLPDCQVEHESEVVLGNLIKFERVYAFRDGDATRKRKVWLVYADTWLIVLTWQGANPEAYDYWEAMANYSFATFQLPQALLLATDRELLNQLRGNR